MNKVSNLKMLQILTKLLILIAIAKMLTLVMWWYLPNNGVELNQKKNYNPKYIRVDFHSMLKSIHKVKKSIKKDTGINITDMILKGIYGTKTDGYAILSMKSNPKKTSIIAVGENYNGYKLKAINLYSIVFQRSGKNYILELEKIKKDLSKRVQNVVQEPDIKAVGVSRNDIEFFEKNPQKIWQQIAIDEVRKNGKINGFKVMRINPNSKFAELGLKKGDIIIKANNIPLKSYKDAIDIYKNINKLDDINVVVLRNNQEKELIYEIN